MFAFQFRENSLQMVLYALMTFPSTYFDIGACVRRATYTACDRKRQVRQAALDVLAVLGQISSTKLVMDIVADIASKRADDGAHLCAAIKARLSRKQLPIISDGGGVQYALRIPARENGGGGGGTSGSNTAGPYLFGADVEWITAGSGSVSPTSMKKRSQRTGSDSDDFYR